MCESNNSDEDMDNYWQSQKGNPTVLQPESSQTHLYRTDQTKPNESDNLSDIDALLSELSSKYCTKRYTSCGTLKRTHTSQVRNANSQTSESVKRIQIVTISDSEDEDLVGKHANYGGEVVTLKKRSPKVGIPLAKTTGEEKRAQRELKKAQDLQEKELKKMINQATKKLKPDEYLKQVEVMICDFLSEKPLAKEIFNVLVENDVKHSKKSQIYPNIITWDRISQSHVVEGGKLISQNESEECEIVLLILECDDFIAMIEKDELIRYFKTVQEILLGKSVTIGLYGVNEYLRLSKNQMRRSFKNDILQLKSKRKELAMFDRNFVETHLTKLQVLLSISYKYLDTPHDVAALVYHMTKAVAQIPYKLKKQLQMEQVGCYIIGDNKDCVVVDKNGNGLSRLWQQSITSFPLARLDLAESVMSLYPTFNSLMQAYEESSEYSTGERLLQHLEIRRAAGPLTNFRKIGPEFSKKVFRYYNSRDPKMIL